MEDNQQPIDPKEVEIPMEEMQRISSDAREYANIDAAGVTTVVKRILHYEAGARTEYCRLQSKIAQLEEKLKTQSTAFAIWAADRGWLLWPDCDEDEETAFYKPSDDFNLPEERMFASQLYDLFIEQTLLSKPA